MFQLTTASSRIILDVVVALTLVPLALECLAGARAAAQIRRRGSGALGPIVLSATACALAVWLAVVFVLPKLSNDASVDSRTGLVVLARAAQAGRWPGQPLQSVVDHARERRSLEDLAELLALAASGRPAWSTPLPDALFIGGARSGSDRRPLATFEGWSAHDAGKGHCEVIVYFRPRVALSGRELWLHEYPEGSHDYIDIAPVLPVRDWEPDALAWEVFRTAEPERFTLYAGVRSGADLGPPVLLGRVDRCAE